MRTKSPGSFLDGIVLAAREAHGASSQQQRTSLCLCGEQARSSKAARGAYYLLFR